MIKLNSPKGRGDAIYLRAIVLHLLAKGKRVKVFTAWPDVFYGLPVKITGANDYTNDDDLKHAMACLHCRVPSIMSLGRWRLTCLQAQITEDVELKMEWPFRANPVVAEIRTKAGGRPIVLYQPLKISKDADQELTRPDAGAFLAALERKTGTFRVKVGSSNFAQDDPRLPCEFDLFDKTTIGGVFDIALSCDLIFSEAACYLPNLAEAMDKPFAAVFSRRAMEAVSRKRVWSMRPDFLIHKRHLATVIYDG